MKEFEIDAYRKGRELLAVLRGRLVLPHCPEAKSRLTSLLSQQVEQAYIHLGELLFLDSAGLGVLVGLKMLANKNRSRLTFLAPPARVEDIFRVSKLDTIFEIRGGVEADVISASLQKDEHCIWKDSKDSRQALFSTDVPGMHTPTRGHLTSAGGTGFDQDEVTQKTRQLCLDAEEYIRLGDYPRAIDLYQRALRLNPRNIPALNNLGIVYEKKPEWYEQAVETWQKVLELSQQAHDEKHAERARKHLSTLEKLKRH